MVLALAHANVDAIGGSVDLFLQSTVDFPLSRDDVAGWVYLDPRSLFFFKLI